MTQNEIRAMILNLVQGNLRWCDPKDPINLKKAEDLGIDPRIGYRLDSFTK